MCKSRIGSSSIQTFAKFVMFSFWAKLCIRWQKFGAVSKSSLISLSVSLSQPFIEYFSLTSVSLLSFLLESSNHFKTFPIIFLLPCAMNLFMPVIPNESINKISLFGEMFKILHQFVPLSSLQIMKGYFFSRHNFFKHHKLVYFIRGKKHQENLYLNHHYLFP